MSRRLLLISLGLLAGCGYRASPAPPLVLAPSPVMVTPSAPTRPITLALVVGPVAPHRGEVAAFSAQADLTSPVEPTVYTWDFGNGETRVTTVGLTFYAYPAPGHYVAIVDLEDGAGRHVRAFNGVIVD